MAAGTQPDREAAPLPLGDDQYELYSKLFDLNNKARAAKALSSAIADFPTPMLVLVGDQTAGKSSLVEALGYGIRLPRNAGTCTRAPLELRLHPGSSTDGCACRISYRPAAGPAANVEHPVHTLTAQEVGDRSRDHISEVVEDLSGFLLGDKDQLPGLKEKHPGWKVPKSGVISALGTYTRDAIILDIYDQPSPLTIVDLPGLIHANAKPGTSPEDQTKDVAFPRELAKSYIKRPDVIIVCVMAGDRDAQSWAAYPLAHAADPQGRRTIGVLTFADKIMGPEGRKAQMKQVLDGETFPLELGYYVVANKVGGSGTDYEQNRKLEQDLFRSDAELFRQFEPRLGVNNLRKGLSKLLANKILSNLNQLDTTLISELNTARKQLQQMEENRTALDNPYKLGMELGVKIEKRIEHNIFQFDLRHRTDPMGAELMQKYQDFAAKVRSTQPALVLREGSKKPLHQLEFPKEGKFKEIPVSRIVSVVSGVGTLARPGQVAPETVQHLHDELLQPWGGYALTCLEQAKEVLTKYVHMDVDKVTEGRERFGTFVKGKLDNLIQKAASSTRDVLVARVQQETDPEDAKTYIFTMHLDVELEMVEEKKRELAKDTAALAKEVPENKDDPFSNAKSKEQIIEHMAYVCTDWKIAYDRFVDNVPMEIRYHLLVGFLKQLLKGFMDAWEPLPEKREEQLSLLDESPADKKRVQEKKVQVTELEGLRQAFEELRKRDDMAELLKPLPSTATATAAAPDRQRAEAVARPATPTNADHPAAAASSSSPGQQAPEAVAQATAH